MTVDVVLDDEGLWATGPVPDVEPVPRAVRTPHGRRAGHAWPLPVDAALPARVAAALEASDDPGPGLLALADLCIAALDVSGGPLVPSPQASGWRWRAAPGPGAAATWDAARHAARTLADGGDPAIPRLPDTSVDGPDGASGRVSPIADALAADLVAALAGPVSGFPDGVPPRPGARRAATLRAWADRVAARRAAGARLVLQLEAPPTGVDAFDADDGTVAGADDDTDADTDDETDDEAADDDAAHRPVGWRLVPLAVRLGEDTTRRPVAAADPADFGAVEAAWQGWLRAEGVAVRTACGPGGLASWFDRLTGTGVAPPVDVTLEPAEVLDLLDSRAQALADTGIDVVAESGLLRRSSVRRTARTRSVGSGLTADGLGLSVGVSVDGVELTPDEVAKLAASKSELVVVRGRWTRIDATERSRIARLLQRVRRPVTAADLLVDEAFDGLEVALPDRLTVGRRVEPPSGLLATLRPYQRDGLDWLTWAEENRTGGVLADDMGLGKTVQVLARVAADHEGPTLVVCPLTLVDTWARQAEQFTPDLRVAVHHGAEREDVAALAERSDVVLTTYGLLARDASVRAVAWHRAVLDEAQAVKNPDTRTARAARALTATHRLAVTGTPVENHLGELRSVLAFASPGILPRRREFERAYVKAAASTESLSRLRAATAPFVLRRTKTDPGVAPDLPPRTVIREDCALTREQVGAYEAAAAAMLEQIDGGTAGGTDGGRAGSGGSTAGSGGRRLHVLAGIARLKQILVHPAMLTERRTALGGRSGKVDRLVDLLAEIVDEGQAAVVFTQFASFVPALATHLAQVLGVDVLTLTGADDRARRAGVVESFGTAGGPPVLVVSLKAGGTGLTLVRANHVVHLDRWWNPAVEDQASDRVWRIGQRQKVFVHTLVCPGTLEDRIDTMLADKRATAASVVRSTQTRVTELTDNELADLVRLVRERVLS